MQEGGGQAQQGLPFLATERRRMQHGQGLPRTGADKTRHSRGQRGALPLRHGIEVLNVGPSIKGQCVEVPCRLLHQP